MNNADELLDLNAAYAAAFTEGDLPMPPSRGLAVITCMDARIPLEKVLGLGNGESHVIRNAGALVTDDTIRCLLISQQALGTSEIMLIAHTDCGMLTLAGEAGDGFLAAAESKAGESLPVPLGGFGDLEQAVRDGVQKIEDSPFVKSNKVRGFIYSVETGALSEV